MKILLVNRYFGGEHVPTGRMLGDVVATLVADGHEIIVMTSRGTYVASGPSEALDSEWSVDVRYLPLTSMRNRLAAWASFWAQVLVRVPWIRWDHCVLLTDPPFLTLAAYLSRFNPFRRGKVSWWTMDLYPEAIAASGMLSGDSVGYRFLAQLNRLGVSALDGVIALGDTQLDRLRQYWSHSSQAPSTTVVPPWDDRRIPRVDRERNRVLARLQIKDKKVALYAGNLGEGHCFEEVVEAAETLVRRGREDWVFLFAVRGSEKGALLARSEGLSNVIVMDYVPQDETPDLLWGASVHLITMKAGWEGIVVPSKLYGVIFTAAPVLFIGPEAADTGREVRDKKIGYTLSNGAAAELVVETLDELSEEGFERPIPDRSDGPRRIADFINSLG